MGFSRQEYWSGLPCPSPGDLPNPGIEPVSPGKAGISGLHSTLRQTQRSPEGPRHLHRIPRLSEAPWDLPDHAGESPLLSRSGGEKGLRGSGAGTLGVPLGGTRRVGGLLGVALFLLFFGTLHSDAYIFPFLLCFLLLFFSQLVVRPPQTAILLFLPALPSF